MTHGGDEKGTQKFWLCTLWRREIEWKENNKMCANQFKLFLSSKKKLPLMIIVLLFSLLSFLLLRTKMYTIYFVFEVTSIYQLCVRTYIGRVCPSLSV